MASLFFERTGLDLNLLYAPESNVSDLFTNTGLGMSFYKTTNEGANGNWRMAPRASAGSRCVVCGDPNSNCRSGADPNPKILFEDLAPADKSMFFVEEDVTEERQITPGRITTILLARKGTYITKKRAAEIGLLP